MIFFYKTKREAILSLSIHQNFLFRVYLLALLFDMFLR